LCFLIPVPAETSAVGQAQALNEKAGAYLLRCFGIDFHVNPCEMLITCPSDQRVLFLGKLKDFFRIALLWYMSNAKHIPQTGRLINPIDVRGGHRFFAGTHLLPVNAIAEKYGKGKAAFIKKGEKYGAEVLSGYGDASIRLYPLPRVAVTMILWMEDEEFPSRVDSSSTLPANTSLHSLMSSGLLP
jgi:hypothetical protein